jgi:addiction module HigA family antidote
MLPLGITVSELARDIGVPPNRISQIVNGMRACSADTALRLGKYFGMSPEIWLDLQSEYELRLARWIIRRGSTGRFMPLSAGDRLGPYEVLGLLGAGGRSASGPCRSSRTRPSTRCPTAS